VSKDREVYALESESMARGNFSKILHLSASQLRLR
jgi:hypothetical protein